MKKLTNAIGTASFNGLTDKPMGVEILPILIVYSSVPPFSTWHFNFDVLSLYFPSSRLAPDAFRRSSTTTGQLQGRSRRHRHQLELDRASDSVKIDSQFSHRFGIRRDNERVYKVG